jgi:hypothetical protein
MNSLNSFAGGFEIFALIQETWEAELFEVFENFMDN